MNVSGTAFKRRLDADLDDTVWKRCIYQTGQVESPSTDMTAARYPSYPQSYGSQREHAPLTVNPVTQGLYSYQGATGWRPTETSVFMPSPGIEVSASERNYHHYSHDSRNSCSPERRNSHSPINVKSYSQTKHTLSYSPSRDSRRNISPRKDSCSSVYYGREQESPYLSLSPVSVRSSHERLDRSVSQSSHNRLDSYSAHYYHNRDSSKVKDSSHFSRQYSQQHYSENLQKRDDHSKKSSQDCHGLSNEYTVIIENLSSDLSNRDIKDCIRGFDCKHVKLKMLNDNMSAVVMFDSYSEAKTMVRVLDQSRFCGRRITVKLQEPVVETYDMSNRQDHYQESERNQSVTKRKESKDSSLFQSYIDASYADVPILGRKYITEFRNEGCSSAYYVCSLCESICSWRSIADHMIGYKHSMKCLKHSHPKVSDELCRIKGKSELLEKCRKYAAVYVNPNESITSRIVKNPQLEASEYFTNITVKINSDNDDNEEWEKKDSSVSNILKKIEAFKKKVNENKDLSSGHPSKRQRMEVSSSHKETEKMGLAATAAAEIASCQVQSDKNRLSTDEMNKEGKVIGKLKYVETRRCDSMKRKNDKDLTRLDNKLRKRKDDETVKKQNDNEVYSKYYEKQKTSRKHFINEEWRGKHDANSFERENTIEYKNKTLENSRRQAYELQKKLDEERLTQDKGIINSTSIEASDGTLVKEAVTVKTFKVVKLSNSEHDALKTIENKLDSQQGTQNKSLVRSVQKEVGISQLAKSKPVYNDAKVVEYADFLDEGLSNVEKEHAESADLEKEIDNAVSVRVNANNMNFSSHPDSKINQFYAEYLKKYPTNSAAIGLQYITEILPTMPSRCCLYLCALCDSECSGQSIAQHIVGYKHRMKYLYLHERDMYNTIMSQQTSRQALNYHCMKFVEGVSMKEGPQKIKSITRHEYELIKRVIKDRMKTKIRNLPETMPQPDVVFMPPCEPDELEICQTPDKPVCAIAAETSDTLQSTACTKGLTGAALSLTNDSAAVAETDSTTKAPQLSTVGRSTIYLETSEIETVEMEDVDKTGNTISLNYDIQDKQAAAFSKQSQIADRITFARFEAKTVKPDDVTKRVWFYKYIQAKAEVPLLGLPYIVEIQGLNPKKPNAPTYICELCCSITKIEGSSSIYTHLLGAKHMEAYIRKHYPHKAAELKQIKMKSAWSKYLQIQARLICESKEADYIRLAVLNAVSGKKAAGSCVAAINTATSVYTSTTNTRTADTSASSIATISSQSQDENGSLQHSAFGDNITAQLYDMISGLHNRPLVGLSYITETQGLYSKLQAKYDCALCNETINANFITAHLSGLDHRLKFLKANYPILHMKCENNWQMVERYCRLIEEQFGRESISVRKWVSTDPDGTAVYSKPQIIKDPYNGKKAEDAVDKKKSEKLGEEINKRVEIPVVDVHQSEAVNKADIKPLETPEKVDEKRKKRVDIPAVDRQQSEAVDNADIELYEIVQGLDCSAMLGDSLQATLPNVGSPEPALPTLDSSQKPYSNIQSVPSGELLPVDGQDIVSSSKSNIIGQISEQLISEEEMSLVNCLPAVTATELCSLDSTSERDNNRPLSPTGLGQKPTATSTSQKTLSPEREPCSTADMSNGNSYTNDHGEENSKINDTLAVKTKIESKKYPSLQKSVNGENVVIQYLSTEVTAAEQLSEPIIENNTEYRLDVDFSMEVTKHKHSEVENESIIEVPDEVQDVNELREFMASHYKVQKIKTDNENRIVMGSLDVDDVDAKQTELTSKSTMNTGVEIINISRDVTTGSCLEVESHVEQIADRSETPDFELVLKTHIEDDFVKVDVLLDTDDEIDKEFIGVAVQNTPTPLDQVSDDKLISTDKQSACDGKFQGKTDNDSIGISTQNTPTPLDQVSDDKLTTSDMYDQSIGIAIQNTPTPLDKVTDDQLTANNIHGKSIGIAIQNTPTPLDQVSDDKFTTTDINSVYDEKFNPLIENIEITKNVTHYAANDKVVVAITEPLFEAGGSTTESAADIVTCLQCHNIIDTIEDTGMNNVHDYLRKRKIVMETEFGMGDQEIHLLDIQKSVNETHSHSGSADSKLGVVIDEKDVSAECLDIDQLSNYVDINEKIEIAKDVEHFIEQDFASISVSSQSLTQLFETHRKPVRLICGDNTNPIPFESNNYFWEDKQDNKNSSEESLSLVINNENLLEQSGYANVNEITQFEVMSVYATKNHNDNCNISIVEDDTSQKNENDSLMFNTGSIDDNCKQADNTDNGILLHSSDENDTKLDTEKNYAVEADFKQNDALTDCTRVVYNYNVDDCDEGEDFEVIMLREDNLALKGTEDLFLSEDFVTQDELQENCNDDTDTSKVGNETELRSSEDIRQHHYESTDASNIPEQKQLNRHVYPPHLFIQSPDNSFTSLSRSVESITSDTSLDDIHSNQDTSVMTTPISITDNECSTPEEMMKEVN